MSAVNEHGSPGGDTVERLLELLGQRSSVRIETNAKGLAQIKVCCYSGESEEEMRRLSALAQKTYVELQATLGRISTFG